MDISGSHTTISATTGLTNERRVILNKFRERVKDVLQPYQEDFFLLRWLRARKFDIQKAETMLRRHVRLYKNLDLSNLIDHSLPEVIMDYTNYSIIGDDKRGNVVLVHLPGITDFNGLGHSLSYADILKWIIYEAEGIFTVSDRSRVEDFHPTKRIVAIFDFSNMKMTSFLDRNALWIQMSVLQFYEANMPEILEAVYAINTPSLFYMWYNIVKVILDPVTVAKIRFYTYSGWQEDILEIIDADILPAFLGGNRTDPDGNPDCHTLFLRKGAVPRRLYIDKEKQLMKKPEYTEVTVNARDTYLKRLNIISAGTKLSWCFETISHGIAFGLRYEGSPNVSKGENTKVKSLLQTKTLIPVENTDTYDVPERGEIICDRPGIYILVFDNSSSFLRSKKLYYSFNITPP